MAQHSRIQSFVGRTVGEPAVLAFLFEAASGSIYKKVGGYAAGENISHEDTK